ncbi:MAG TPA: hypothetical protein PKV69_02050 [Candidatus Hydrogenedentes bacterium]|nr:hypothetical protein [Candidatus Hydrogenedentota bacterium]
MSEETQAEIQRRFPRIDYREVRDGDLRLLPEAVTMDTYRPHRACRAYVAHRAAASAGIPLPALAEKARIPLEVLRRKKPRYDALSGRVPAAYLAAIGVDYDDLRRCHAIDCAEYEIVNSRAEFPKTYTVRTPNETVRVAFPAGVTKFHHALAHLLGCAARAAAPASPQTVPGNTGTRFVIAWPHVKVLEFDTRDPLRIDLRSNRPVLKHGRWPLAWEPGYDDDAFVLGSLGGWWDDSGDHGDPIPTPLWRFLRPHRAFFGNLPATAEQIALFSPIARLLDEWDPALDDDWGDWPYSGEIGPLYYVGAARKLCLRLGPQMTLKKVRRLLKNTVPFYGWKNQRDYETVVKLMARDVLNTRRIYRGEPPVEYAPLAVPERPSWASRNPHDEHSLPYGDPYHSPPEDLPPRARQELMKTKNRTQPRGDLE